MDSFAESETGTVPNENPIKSSTVALHKFSTAFEHIECFQEQIQSGLTFTERPQGHSLCAMFYLCSAIQSSQWYQSIFEVGVISSLQTESDLSSVTS